jgi:hypothetical protein
VVINKCSATKDKRHKMESRGSGSQLRSKGNEPCRVLGIDCCRMARKELSGAKKTSCVIYSVSETVIKSIARIGLV